ncbi:MAG: EF-P lysine aminoacylase EpmA [Polyangia bacterium]
MTEAERLAGRLRNLERRAALNRAVRRFFDERGFVEIEAPILVPSPGLELHLDAFEVSASREPRYLITSPEYQMKRLLAGGMERIYSLGKVFRRGELGAHHNPEFTMLEWYRAGEGWQAIADDVEALVAGAARALLGDTTLTLPDGRTLALDAPWERLSVADATERFAGARIEGDESLALLGEKVRSAGHRVPDEGGWDDLFFTLFLDAVEPRLGRDRPTLLYDWPRPLCALAREKPGDPRVVERFEVYAAGLELCNAFGELTDPVEQRRRLEADRAARAARGLPLYPIDEKFLAALATLPPSSGIALGVDRLAMLLLGATDIRDVLPFKDDEL